MITEGNANGQMMNRGDDNHGPMIAFDLEKFLKVLRSSIPWVVIFVIFGLTAAYLNIRWTKPLYKSTSVIQLDVQNEASTFGFRSFDDDLNNLSREIELIKSNLFLGKVVDALGFDISTYAYGEILNEEKYPEGPFQIEVLAIKDESMYNLPININVIDNLTFNLHYELGELTYEHKYKFGDIVDNQHVTMVINTRKGQENPSYPYYFFTINSRQAILNYLKSNLEVFPLDFKAKTIEVVFNDHSKAKARDVLTAIDTLFIYFTELDKNKANAQKIDFLDKQLSITEKKLTELENYFENFTVEHRTTSLDNNINNAIQQLAELDTQAFFIQNRVKTAADLLESLNSNEQIDVSVLYNPGMPGEIKSLMQSYQSLQDELTILLGSYNQNTYAFEKRNNELIQIKAKVVDYLTTYLENQQAQLKSTREQKNLLEKKFSGMPSMRTEYTKTKRFYTLYEEFYFSLIQNKAQFQLAQAGTVTNYKILSPATIPTKQISPKNIVIYMIGLFAALMLSFLFVTVKYLLNNKITSQTELEFATSIPVLGTLPELSKDKLKNSRLVVNQNPKSELSEAFRTLRTNLEFVNSNNEKPVIAVTSTISGEGKTFVSANLGAIISMMPQKVVLIDLDMRKPKLQKVFYLSETSQGVSTILIGKHGVDECIIPTDVDNLYYIPSGPIPPNPAELILSKNFDTLIEQLKERFDVIIMDTPPVGLVTDGILAIKKATIPLYVMRANYSKRNFLFTLKKLLKTHHVKNLSIILNGAKSAVSYGYGYQSKHGYYEEKEEKTFSETFKSLFGL